MDDEDKLIRIDERTLIDPDGFAYDYELLDFEARDERDAEAADAARAALRGEPGRRSKWAA